MSKKDPRDWAGSGYVRLYYTLASDAKFDEVYASDSLLATYVRLLIAADQAYPAPASLPFGCKPKAIDQLVGLGIIQFVNRRTFRVLALQKEREYRSGLGRAAAQRRWDADAMRTHSGGDADPMLAETENETEKRTTPTPPPSSRKGLRENGTNPRAAGTNPRADRDATKRGPTALGQIIGQLREQED
jgi:hypothetical protein